MEGNGQSITVGLVRPYGFGLAYPQWQTPVAPAAGAVFTDTVPGHHYARILAVRCSVSTDSNAANRLVTFDFVNARGSTFVQNGAAVIVTASTTGQVFEWSVSRTVSEWNTNTPIWAPLADLFLPPAFQFKINIQNIQVGDTITGISIWREHFPTGPRGFPDGQVIGDPSVFTGLEV